MEIENDTANVDGIVGDANDKFEMTHNRKYIRWHTNQMQIG